MSREITIIKKENDRWKKAGFTIPEMNKWKSENFDLQTAKRWNDKGFTIEGALAFTKEGLNAEESKNLITQEIAKKHGIDSIIIKLQEGIYTKDDIYQLIQKEKMRKIFFAFI